MHSNEQIIRDFYECFSRRDGEGMVKHYAQQVRFSDPVFTDLRGDQARAMWRMLTSRAADLRVEFRDVRADEASGRAHRAPSLIPLVTRRPTDRGNSRGVSCP